MALLAGTGGGVSSPPAAWAQEEGGVTAEEPSVPTTAAEEAGPTPVGPEETGPPAPPAAVGGVEAGATALAPEAAGPGEAPVGADTMDGEEEAAEPAPATEEAAVAPPQPEVNWAEVPNPVPAGPASIERGRGLYNGKGLCNVCHGEKGDGFGPVRDQFDPYPNAFFDPEWHGRLSDGDLMGFLVNGKLGTGMIPVVPEYLTETEAWDVVNYLRTFQGKTSEDYERYRAAVAEAEAAPQAEGETP